MLSGQAYDVRKVKEEIDKLLADDRFYEGSIPLQRMLTDGNVKEIQDELGKKHNVKIFQ